MNYVTSDLIDMVKAKQKIKLDSEKKPEQSKPKPQTIKTTETILYVEDDEKVHKKAKPSKNGFQQVKRKMRSGIYFAYFNVLLCFDFYLCLSYFFLLQLFFFHFFMLLIICMYYLLLNILLFT